MTTTVLVLVNGPSYEVTLTKRDSAGNVLETQKRRGAPGAYGQGLIQAYVGSDQTIEITEKYTADPHPLVERPDEAVG